MGWKVLWVPDLAAFLQKGKVSEQLLWQPKWPQHVPGHFESLTLPFITKENPCIIHKICCQEKFLIAPLPAGMNAENFQLFYMHGIRTFHNYILEEEWAAVCG